MNKTVDAVLEVSPVKPVKVKRDRRAAAEVASNRGRRKAGNPTWGKPNNTAVIVVPTDWEGMLVKYNLVTRRQCLDSNELLAWAKRWSKSKYIPEWYLKAKRMYVEELEF